MCIIYTFTLLNTDKLKPFFSLHVDDAITGGKEHKQYIDIRMKCMKFIHVLRLQLYSAFSRYMLYQSKKNALLPSMLHSKEH